MLSPLQLQEIVIARWASVAGAIQPVDGQRVVSPLLLAGRAFSGPVAAGDLQTTPYGRLRPIVTSFISVGGINRGANGVFGPSTEYNGPADVIIDVFADSSSTLPVKPQMVEAALTRGANWQRNWGVRSGWVMPEGSMLTGVDPLQHVAAIETSLRNSRTVVKITFGFRLLIQGR